MKREFFRYIGVGGAAFIADFCLLAVLNVLGLHYLPAVTLAFLLGTWVNYQLSVRWVFSYRALEFARKSEFGVFVAVGIVGAGIGLALIAFMVEMLGWHVLAAKGAAAVVTLALNFGGRKLLLFTRKRESPECYGLQATAR